ncbi:DUF2141 domain-containing protein [Spirosoma sp. BT702]|uniref:DUF2141 domain-containing protein n=1 Tax=Spirosoma profusum TaxID=2771354 RepID=A0A926Y3S7_9BACT|nr:DUF2141 domain-containing protein [Spirosoma profusum]MBD2702215.1 DUF2141 domain-containing protein [Spirosoma profusum]
MRYLLFALSLCMTAFVPRSSPKKTNLTVEIQNVQPLKGTVFVALFPPGNEFPNGKPIDGKKVDAESATVRASFSVEPGTYAIAIFHDENSNGKMDKKMFGIPKEPYGFSNNFRPKMSAPKFSDCQFTVGNGGKTIQIALKKF